MDIMTEVRRLLILSYLQYFWGGKGQIYFMTRPLLSLLMSLSTVSESLVYTFSPLPFFYHSLLLPVHQTNYPLINKHIPTHPAHSPNQLLPSHVVCKGYLRYSYPRYLS